MFQTTSIRQGLFHLMHPDAERNYNCPLLPLSLNQDKVPLKFQKD